jgi:hypothetical protein
MRKKYLAIGSAFVLALTSTLAAGCGAESVGVEEMPVFTDDTQILPVDGGGLGVAPSIRGWYALTHVEGVPLPVPDPYRTDGVTILSGSMHLGDPLDWSDNVFYYCLSNGYRYQAWFTYERTSPSSSNPEFLFYVFPITDSGVSHGDEFLYDRYHTDVNIDPIQYRFDRTVPVTC